MSIIVPCRNERNFAAIFVRSIESQDLAGVEWEVIIADGMSTDGTRDELKKAIGGNQHFHIINNPEGIASTALNAAIHVARGDVIVRLDMHTEYQADYVKSCLAVLADTHASNVGGPWLARGTGYVGSAIAAAFQFPLGCGGGRAHDPDYEGPVDTVYLGCWPREVFAAVGEFDEDLVRNQDDEHNFRLERAGRLIYQSPRIRSWYKPRSSISNLFKQYFQYGYWKTISIRKHQKVVSLRHVVPAAFVAFNVGLLLLLLFVAILRPGVNLAFVSVPFIFANTVYLLVIGWTSALVAAQKGLRLLPILPLVFATYHVAYGSGFLVGMWHWALERGTAKHARLFRDLTR